MLNKFKKNYIDNNRYIFIIVSILFGLCFICEVPHGDDLGFGHKVEFFSISNVIKLALEKSEHTFNRLLAYIGCITFNSLPLFFFVVAMSLAMYLLLSSLRVLFSKNSKYEKYLNAVIAFLVLTYSYSDMASAGWIITSTMHFFLIAFGYTALIPIAKILRNEKIGFLELLLYVFSLIYTSSMEQGMAFLLAFYVLFSIYFVARNIKATYVHFLSITSIVCALNTLLSRSNSVRIITETIKHFPTINMLNIISKIDIGLSSTLYWLFFEQHFFTIIIYCIFALLIFNRYKKRVFRLISLIPILLIVSLKKYMASNTAVNAFEINPIEFGNSNFGLININSINNFSTYFQYFVYSLLVIITIVEIYLLVDKFEDLYFISVLIIAGFGSRMALALTPNVFISHFRTCIYLAFAIIVSCIIVYRNNIKYINDAFNKYLNYLYILGALFMLMYTFAYVYNYLGHSLFELFR